MTVATQKSICRPEADWHFTVVMLIGQSVRLTQHNEAHARRWIKPLGRDMSGRHCAHLSIFSIVGLVKFSAGSVEFVPTRDHTRHKVLAHKVYFRREYLYNALFTHFTSAWTECTDISVYGGQTDAQVVRENGKSYERKIWNESFQSWRWAKAARNENNSSFWRAHRHTRAHISLDSQIGFRPPPPVS